MKSLKSLLLLFFIIACSKDDNGGLSLATMSATIDNVSWQTISRVTVLQNGIFNITGTSIDGKILNITIKGDQEGTYQLGLTSLQCGAVYKQSATTSTDDAFASVTGNVVLTDVNTTDHKISGTFEFSLMKELTLTPMTITDGKFENLFYTVTAQ
jgi:hypothetical protein